LRVPFTSKLLGMATVVSVALLALLVAALLVYLMWIEREKSLWKRLEPALAILGSLLLSWAVERYGDSLLHWIARHHSSS
jgi:hypothetical protein